MLKEAKSKKGATIATVILLVFLTVITLRVEDFLENRGLSSYMDYDLISVIRHGDFEALSQALRWVFSPEGWKVGSVNRTGIQR